MHPDHTRIFEHFLAYEVAIIGSSVRDFDRANDIDVLFLPTVNFRQLCVDMGIVYRGKWDRVSPLDGVPETIRQVRMNVPGVEKRVQLTQNSRTHTFDQHPFCTLLRDGTRLNDGVYFDKEKYVIPSPKRYPTRYP